MPSPSTSPQRFKSWSIILVDLKTCGIHFVQLYNYCKHVQTPKKKPYESLACQESAERLLNAVSPCFVIQLFERGLTVSAEAISAFPQNVGETQIKAQASHL